MQSEFLISFVHTAWQLSPIHLSYMLVTYTAAPFKCHSKVKTIRLGVAIAFILENMWWNGRCESFSTYPRTYDLLHAFRVLSAKRKGCHMIDIMLEMDRMLRPMVNECTFVKWVHEYFLLCGSSNLCANAFEIILSVEKKHYYKPWKHLSRNA